MEKTVKQINEWFQSEVREALEDIPEPVKNYAKINPDLLKIVAADIGRRKGFNTKAVLKYLKTII